MITIVAKNFIGGVWHEGELNLLTRNPAKLSVVAGQAHSAAAEDVAYAVKVAQKSLDKSHSAGPGKRADLVDFLVQPMRRYATEIAKYLTHECGFTLKESQEEVLEAIRYCQHAAGQGAQIAAQQMSWYPASRETRFVRRPVGVVACMPCWSEPFAGALKMALPAIMAGNTVIIKAPEHAIAISQWLARLILESGLGEGYVSVVHGPDDDVGELLASDPGVHTLVGDFDSDRLAKYKAIIAGQASVQVFSSGVGLNGLAAFADANVDQAATLALSGALAKTGQKSSSTKVAWIAEPIYDAFVKKIEDLAKLVRSGDGLNEDTTMGPMSNKVSYESFLSGIGTTDCRVVSEGCPLDETKEENLLVRPHIVCGDSKTETYLGNGPCLQILPLESIDQLARPMNCLSIVTKSTETVRKVRERAACNRLLVNCATTSRIAPNWHADIANVTRIMELGIEA